MTAGTEDLVAPAATVVAGVIGKAVRDGKQCYYINDGVYHTFSGVIFDHIHYHIKAFKTGPTSICSVFGPTCDALKSTVSLAEAASRTSNAATWCIASTSGMAYTHALKHEFQPAFLPAKVVHLNRWGRGRRQKRVRLQKIIACDYRQSPDRAQRWIRPGRLQQHQVGAVLADR